MRSATDFLPSYIRQFMNLVNTLSPNFASGKTSRLTAARRRDMTASLFRALGAVFRAALAAVLDPLGIERAANDVIPHPRQVLDPAATNQDDRMLLKIVALSRNVARHFKPVRQAHARHLAQRGIGLFRRGRVDARAHPALLRAGFHRRDLIARHLRSPRIADELVYRRHRHDLVKHDNCPRRHRRRGDKFPYRNSYAPPHRGAEPQTDIGLRLSGFLRPAPNRPILLVIQTNPVKASAFETRTEFALR